MSRAELHFHILPGVDDGPQTMEESLELAALAVSDGTSTVVSTPHVRLLDVDELPDRVDELRRRLDESGVPLEVRSGGELASGDVASLTDAQLDGIAHGPDAGRWLLLEAPLPDAGGSAGDFAAAAQELRRRGFGVLVGHPERSPAVFSDGAAALHAELAAGSLLQLNATSLTGRHGEPERVRGLALAAGGLAAAVASDAHRPTRGPALGAALRALLDAGIPTGPAHDMVDVAPRAILERGLRERRISGDPSALPPPG
jgi:protein-tyrosine phosphatase